MNSRRKAGDNAARTSQVSRRAVLAGGSATPAFAVFTIGDGVDPSVALCQRWLANDTERRRLQAEWSNREAWLIKHRRWFRLSKSEQAAIPEGARLAEIDARLDVLEVEGHALLKAMRPKPARSIEAVVANLSVAARLIFVEDHPQAHGLITRAVRDLAAFSGRA